jgi:hypothetical protein
MEMEDHVEQPNLTKSQRERRAFLERAGKLASFTPPLMLGLLIPNEYAIASGAYGISGTKEWKEKKEKKEKKPKPFKEP